MEFQFVVVMCFVCLFFGPLHGRAGRLVVYHIYACYEAHTVSPYNPIAFLSHTSNPTQSFLYVLELT